MTGPFPGQGDIPQPWGGGQPRYSSYSDYGANQDGVGQPWDGQQPEPSYFSAGFGGPLGGPPRAPNKKVTAAIVVALVVVVGAGVGLWWFAVGPGRSGTPTTAPATSSRRPPTTTSSHPPSTSPSPNTSAAYDVGSCFDEANGISAGKVELNPVSCGGAAAVFVINKVVDTVAECDSGADFKDHGYEVPDETANVAYCASLVVPVNDCFVLGGAKAIERTACGSGPNVVRVLAIESAPSAATACTDKKNPDVWFYQSPMSGQFACVSRVSSTGTSSSTTTPPAG